MVVSISRISFINRRQASPELLQSVAVPSGCRVGRQLEQFANFFKGVFVPNLEDDHFALLPRQSGEVTHRLRFFRRIVLGSIEPTPGLKLPRNPPPQRSFVIQSPVAERPNTIVLRFRWRV